MPKTWGSKNIHKMVSTNYSVINHENGLREVVRTTSVDGRVAYTHARFGDGILCMERTVFPRGFGFGSPMVLDYVAPEDNQFEDLDKLLREALK